MLEASCVGGVVTADGVPVVAAVPLSQGIGQSSGVLLLDGDNAAYLADTSPDLDATLQQIISALDKTVTALGKCHDALSSIDGAGYVIAVIPGSGGASGTPSPPVAASAIAGITTASADITAAKTQLQTLKAQLK